MRHWKCPALVGLLLAAAAASTLAAQAQTAATTQPQQQPPPQNRSPFRSAGDRYFDGRSFGGGQPRNEWRRGDARPEYPVGGGGDGGGGHTFEQQDYVEPSPEEWKEIEKFMEDHSPERLRRLADIHEDRHQSVKRMLVTRYRSLQDLKEQDPELFKIRVDRMLIEDQVFGIGWELNHEGDGDPSTEDRKELQAKLREKLGLLFKSGLQERAHRLKHWEQVLEQHRKRLKDDEAKLDDAVNRYMRDVQDQRWPRFLRPLPQRRQRQSSEAEDRINDNGEAPPPREDGVPE